MRQLGDIPKEAHDALYKSIDRTTKFGLSKARAIAPVVTGDLRSKFSRHVYQKGGEIFGFINFHDGTKEAAIKFGAVNYGRKNARTSAGTRLKMTAATGQTGGYHTRETVKALIMERHKRAVKRLIDKALMEAVRG